MRIKLIKLLKFLFLLSSLSILNSTAVYKSCLHALQNNNFISNTYNIQSRIGGAISEIECEAIKDVGIVTVLDNNKENLTTLARTQAKYFIIVDIQYENFDDTDVTELLKTIGVCQQTMHFINAKAANFHNRFLLWDGSYTSFIANDGICNCLISEICEQTNDPQQFCAPNIQTVGNPVFSYNGKIAVLPQRLPLKRIEAGDTNDGVNRFSIGK
ncbi:unnamed protein product [Dimorphilus gyrociliatus]|uniref:Uncharacterized protein n=1 Tax=Dimorphilus gyrociliatus TaxID=2664684 RepID=A0A7I8WDV4_9ANNE|nr:unnamed protein product [Dimorphilus gyrociliatus]